jgi:hypothetical protein
MHDPMLFVGLGVVLSSAIVTVSSGLAYLATH